MRNNSVMNSVSVRTAAQHLDVSEQEVRRQLAVGRVRGEKVSGVWLVDPGSLPSVPANRGRPLDTASAWALAAAADGDGRSLDHLSAVQRHRSLRRLAKLAGSPDPLPLVRSWMARRAEKLRLSAADLDGVRADRRVVLSGVSDPRSGISALDIVEGYVLHGDIEQLKREHLLVPADVGRANVLLGLLAELPEPLPWLMVVADLADGGPREAQQAENLIAERLQHDH